MGKKDIIITELENDDVLVQMDGNVITWAEINGKPEQNKALIALLTELLEEKVDKKLIEAGVHTKITYDENGLVVAGEDLSLEDLPELHLENIVDVEATAEEVNKLHNLEATKEEIDKLHNLKATTSELDTLHGLKATTAELNRLKGLLVASAQLNLLANARSNIQEQLDNKMDKVDFDIEDQGNKVDTFYSESKRTYPSSYALKKGLDTKQNKLSQEQLDRLDNAVTPDNIGDLISGKLDANDPIQPGTATKVEYDEKGLIVGKRDLEESDIPQLRLKKISDVNTPATELNQLQGLRVYADDINKLSGIEDNVQDQFDNITELLPREATEENKLADKQFVKDWVYDHAGFFLTKDQYNTPFASMSELLATHQFYDNGKLKPLTEHDYVVITCDETRNSTVTMYAWIKDEIYNEGHWKFQYKIANSYDDLTFSWGNIVGNIFDQTDLIAQFTARDEALQAHKDNKNNPHSVTKTQVGLGNVDNTSDMDKPVSTAQGEAISEVDTALTNHKNDTNNPHSVTKAQVGLGNVDNTSDANKPISTATQNALNAITDKIPAQASASNQLADKDFVNSTVATNTAHFRGTYLSVADLEAYAGEKNNNDYAYVTTVDSLGNTAYDRYKYNGTAWAYEYTLNNSSFTADEWAAIQSGMTATLVTNTTNHLSNTSNPHSVTKAQVGLGNVDNTSDVDKPVSTAQQTALDGKVDKTTTASKIYGTNGSGAQTTLSYGNTTSANAIVQRDANSQVAVPETPTDNGHASSKKYVDTQRDTRVEKTTSASKVYGTDANGDQTTYDADSFGKVDDVKVGNTSVVTNKVANLGTMAGEDKDDYVGVTDSASKVYGTDAQGNQTTYDADSFGQVDDVKVGENSVVTNKVAQLGTMAGEDKDDYATATDLSDEAEAREEADEVINERLDEIIARTNKAIHRTGEDTLTVKDYNITELTKIEVAGKAEYVPEEYIDSVTVKGVTEYIPETYLDTVTAKGATEYVPEDYLDSVTLEGGTELVSEDYLDTVVAEGGTELISEDYLDTVVAEGGCEYRSYVPSTMQQVEYVNNQKGQTRIETGVVLEDDFEMEIRFTAVSGSNYLFQSREPSSNMLNGISGSLNGNTIIFSVQGSSVTSNISRTVGDLFYIKATAKNGTATLYVKNETTNVEDVKTGTYNWGSLSDPQAPVCLWGNTKGDLISAGVKIYFAKCKIKGKYVIDMIPATNNNVAGMYDKVTDTFYSALAGQENNLVAGNAVTAEPNPDIPVELACNNGVLKYEGYGLPNGYTKVDYAESDGNQQVFIDYYVNEKTKLFCRYMMTQAGSQIASAVFGCVNVTPTTNVASQGVIRLLDGTSSTFNRMGWGNTEVGSIIDTQAPKELNQWYEVFYDQENLYQDGVLYATSATDPTAGTWTSAVKLCLYGRNGNGVGEGNVSMPFKGRISDFWIKEGDEYKVYLVPVKDSNNQVGFYDTINRKFYNASGSGSLTYGESFPSYFYTDGTTETVTDNVGNTATCTNLFAIGTYKDTQEILSGAVTRNVGIKVLDGTENWTYNSMISGYFTYKLPNQYDTTSSYRPVYCSHFESTSNGADNTCVLQYKTFSIKYNNANGNVTAFKQFLADQYANGTPVIVVYPTNSATTESVTGQLLQKSPVTYSGSIAGLTGTITESVHTTPAPTTPLQIKCNNGILTTNYENLIDFDTVEKGYYIKDDGTISESTNWAVTDYIPVTAGESYVLSGTTYTSSAAGFNYYNSSKVIQSTIPYVTGVNTLVIPSGIAYIKLTYRWVDDENTVAFVPATEVVGEQEILRDGAYNNANVTDLYKVNNYIDTQNILTGAVTRNTSTLVLTGSETYSVFTGSGKTSVFLVHIANSGGPGNGSPQTVTSSHFISNSISTSSMDNLTVFERGDTNLEFFIRYDLYDNDVNGFKAWIREQYRKGRPVTIVYPLTTAVTETITPQDLTKYPVTQTAGAIDGLTVIATHSTHSNGKIQQPLQLKCNNGILNVENSSLHVDGTKEAITDNIGNTVQAQDLYKLNNAYKDTQELLTGNVSRTISIKILDGTESWTYYNGGCYFTLGSGIISTIAICSHAEFAGSGLNIVDLQNDQFTIGASNGVFAIKNVYTSSLTTWVTRLQDLMNAGKPVIIIYAKGTATSESVTPQLLTKYPVTQTAGSISGLTVTATHSIHNTPQANNPLQLKCNNGIIKVVSVLDKATATKGKHGTYGNNTDGTTSTWAMGDFAPVIPGTTLVTFGMYYSSGSGAHNFYDANKNFLGATTGQVHYQHGYNEFKIPNNAYYVRVSYRWATEEEEANAQAYNVYVEGTQCTVADNNSHIALVADLFKVNNTYQDSQELITGTITRKTDWFVYDGSQTLGSNYLSTHNPVEVGALVVKGVSSSTESKSASNLNKGPVTQTAGALTIDVTSTQSSHTTPSVRCPLQMKCNNGTLTKSGNNVVISGTAETIKDNVNNTANIANLFAINSTYTDSQSVLDGQITRKCQAIIYNGQSFDTPYKSTTGALTNGAIVVYGVNTTESVAPQLLTKAPVTQTAGLTTTINVAKSEHTTPTVDNPLNIKCLQGVLTNVGGEVVVNNPTTVTLTDNHDNTATIGSLYSVGDVTDTQNINEGEIERKIGAVIYNGQTIEGDYMSTTGALTNGAIVLYELDESITETTTTYNLELEDGANTYTVNNSAVEGVNITVDYKAIKNSNPTIFDYNVIWNNDTIDTDGEIDLSNIIPSDGYDYRVDILAYGKGGDIEFYNEMVQSPMFIIKNNEATQNMTYQFQVVVGPNRKIIYNVNTLITDAYLTILGYRLD